MPVRSIVKIFLFSSDFGQKHLRVSFDVEKSCLERRNTRNKALKKVERRNLDVDSCDCVFVGDLYVCRKLLE